MNIRSASRLASALVLVLPCFAGSAKATVQTFGPFKLDDTQPDVIKLDGEIDLDSALNFHRAIQADPKAKLLVLNSPGGLVQIALLIAEDVYERKLSTYIPSSDGCYSACSFVFLAGAERKVDGKLGVHQISAVDPTKPEGLVGAQSSISDILDVLTKFKTPIGVMTIMLKTPPNDIHVFTPEEIKEYGINRKAAEAPSVASSGPPVATPSPESNPPPPSAAPSTTSASLQGNASASEGGAALQKLTALQQYVQRPTRVAVFAGLDFFGADLLSQHTADIAGCARSCLAMDGRCRAFTFNANPRSLRGPNCFLKGDEGRRDGNAIAISGELLTSADPDPAPFTMGVIDPKTGIFDHVDLPGGDLSSHPHSRGQTAQQCRLACVADNRCVAFTFVRTKRECWLKGSVIAPRFEEGMVSGVKKIETFAPAKIISLQ